MTPAQQARVSIDALPQQAGWHVCNRAHANIHAARASIRTIQRRFGMLRARAQVGASTQQ